MAGARPLIVAPPLPALAAPAAPDDAARCAALGAAGSRTLLIVGASLAPAANGGPACRVEAVARPRATARVRVEVWLPARADWSGRYYQMGNGGFAGSIHRPTLAAAAARGDAAAATDTGHVGDGFDAGWASGRPDLVLDYAHRSIKLAADAARSLIARYYGRPARRRYFMGCSYGGRQALVAAARWPRDWDGVVAGAPAYRWTETLTGFARIAHAVETGRDAATVRRTLERAGYPVAAIDPGELRRWALEPAPDGPSQRRFAVQAYRHLFGARPDWTPLDFRPARDAAPPRVRRAFAIGDLRPFLRSGGKVVGYFGGADPVLPPASAVGHWRGLSAAMGGAGRLRRSYRLFMVPGMGHCQGGAAPHAFGQSLSAPAARDDARHDVRRALERWVERGAAPDELVAGGPDGGQRRTRVLAPFDLAAPLRRPPLD